MTVECTSDEIGRVYKINDGVGYRYYHSVTTMLGATADHTAIENWKERIGEAEASKEMHKATTFGTRFHELCEEYAEQGKWDKKADWYSLRLFNQVKPLIDKLNVEWLHLEVPLYSDKLRLAGTADAICLIDGVLTVLDYKTSKRLKLKEWITDYFLQLACYAWMYRELTGDEPQKGVIIFAHKVDTQPAKFEVDLKEYYAPMIERVNQFTEYVNGLADSGRKVYRR